MLKIVFITNEAAPYRVPVLNKIAERDGIRLQVIFCCSREPNRFWDLPPFQFEHIFLRDRYLTLRGRYIHHNPDIFPALKQFDPDVVVTDGYNPTHLYAFTYSMLNRKPHVVMTDGTDISEQNLSRIHKMVRRFIFDRAKAFVSASAGGKRLFESYGIDEDHCFKSCLCTDNQAYQDKPEAADKSFDFIFCGRIEKIKNPLFALEVARETALRLNRKVHILFVGSGNEEEAVQQAASAQSDLIEAQFNGFAAQGELPSLYHSARIFLFPTLWDPWGVVANEACAAGLPVIVSPNAGAANELVRDAENGFVCDLDASLWANRAEELLTQPDTYSRFSERSLDIVSTYTFDHAASGLIDACLFAASNDTRPEDGPSPSAKASPPSSSGSTQSKYCWSQIH
jgi:glycosyltransferase involved in cell wall biosynthesis